MTNKKIGIGICGSFCSFSKILPVIKQLAQDNRVTPVLSYAAQSTDTRFYKAADFLADLKQATGREPILTVADAEQVGPQDMFDVFLISPCTGNTMAKMCAGITDTPVLMAAKAHLRNLKPVVIGFSTNDALSAGGANIGTLLNRKNVYFVPFAQDDPVKKPRSMAALFDKCEQALDEALCGRQLQPIIG